MDKPNRTRTSLRLPRPLMAEVDSYKWHYSLPGRPASRNYVVERVLREGLAALLARGIKPGPVPPDSEDEPEDPTEDAPEDTDPTEEVP